MDSDPAMLGPRRPEGIETFHNRLSVLAAALGVLLTLKHAIGPFALEPWIITPWALSYDLGWIPRALVGTLFGGFFGAATYPKVYFVYLSVFALLYVLCAWRIGVAAKRSQGHQGLLLLGLLFIVLAMPYQLTARMLGRFDLLLIGLFFLYGYLIETRLFALAIAVCVIAAMIHEAFLVTFLPACLTIGLVAPMKRRPTVRFGTITLVAILPVAAYLLLRSNVDSLMPHAELVARVQERAGFAVSPHMLQQGYYWGVEEHFLNSRAWIRRPNVQFHAVASPIVLLPLLFVFYTFWQSVYRRARSVADRVHVMLLISSACAPLAMVMVGVDYWRWVMISLILHFYCIYYCHTRRPEGTDHFVQWLERNVYYLVFLVVWFAVCGPMADLLSFEFLEKLHQVISQA